MNAPVRFRIKGSSVYVEPVARLHASADSAPYQTVGSGGRSTRWRPSSLGPNAALDYAASTLRNQSRDLVRKNALASAAIDRISSNVVGTGIRPKPPTEEAQKLWLKWTDESDASGALDVYGQQNQVMASVPTAGECFVRLRTRLPQDGLSVPLQLEILESEFVPTDKNESPQIQDGRTVRGEIRQGIEFHPNVRSRPVAYWMHPRHPGDSTNGAASNEPIRVPASEVLHIFWPGRPGQIRGEPWLARVLDRLKDIESYDKAELVRKKISAMFAGFIHRPTPQGLTVEELKDFWGEAEEESGIGAVSLEPGTLQVLEPGEEVEFSDPKDVGGQYEVFMRAQHRAVAASLGILYEQLTGDYSQVNDRTWRAAVNEFRRRCEQWQHHLMVFQFCRPVWRRWAELALLSGALKGIDPAAPVPWTPPRWPYINPVQDIESIEKEIQAGINSRQRAVSERGEDAAIIDREQAEDNTRADGLKLKYSSDGRHAAKASAPKGDNGGSPLGDDDQPRPHPIAKEATDVGHHRRQ